MNIGWTGFIALLFSNFACSAWGATRVPRSENERSLLYWRFLCESQTQIEYSRTSGIELVCKEQGWRVISAGDQVVEVVDDAKN